MKNLYSILDLPRDATPDEIQRRYRKLAKQLHPDVLGHEQTAEEAIAFFDLQSAYDVLSDPEKREYYDRTGDTDAQARLEEVEGTIIDLASKLIFLLPSNENFVEAIGEKIKTGIAKLGGDEVAEKKNLDRIRKLQKRIYFTEHDGRRDLLGKLLQEKETNAVENLANIARNIELSAEALTYLSSFTDEPMRMLMEFAGAETEPDEKKTGFGERGHERDCPICGGEHSPSECPQNPFNDDAPVD